MMQRATPEHGSRVRAMVVPDHKKASLLPHIRKNVATGTMLYTDALRSYRGLEPEYAHAFVDHMVTYVKGRVHTNTIENFWSCLKRMVKGTYICPRPFHMDAYVEEQVFRFNVREGNDAERFLRVLKNTDGRRLTRKALITSNPSLRIGQRGPIHRVQAQ